MTVKMRNLSKCKLFLLSLLINTLKFNGIISRETAKDDFQKKEDECKITDLQTTDSLRLTTEKQENLHTLHLDDCIQRPEVEKLSPEGEEGLFVDTSDSEDQRQGPRSDMRQMLTISAVTR